jgi:hypothetical protein
MGPGTKSLISLGIGALIAFSPLRDSVLAKVLILITGG